MKIEGFEMTAEIQAGSATQFTFQPQPEDTAVDETNAWLVQHVAFDPFVARLVLNHIGVRYNLLAAPVEIIAWPGVSVDTPIIVPRMSRIMIEVANKTTEAKVVTVKISGVRKKF